VTEITPSIRKRLWEVALDQSGYVTSEDARELGIPVVELGKLAYHGRLERVAYGIYRFDELPVTPVDSYQLAVLWAGGRAVLSHDTALDLYELCDINPSKIHLTVPPGYRPRRKGGQLYLVHHEHLASDAIGRVEGVPAVKPRIAIAQCIRGEVPSRLLNQAIDTARARGLISETEQETFTDGLRVR
jgi:predicted transcriptional regulator of viral defense system